MKLTLPLFPIWVAEFLGGILVILFAYLSFLTARRLRAREPENALWLFLGWLTTAFLLFALLHSTVLVLPELAEIFGYPEIWQRFESWGGGVDTLIFVIIAATTLFFSAMQLLYRRMAADHHQLEETSQEILALNREMESLVMERTMSEMALGMAHGIRNPLHVIGGFSQRLLRKTDDADPTRDWLRAIADEARRIEKMVERFETLAQRKTSFFSQEDLNDIIQSTLELLRPEIRAKNINLAAELHPSPLMGKFNRHLLKVAISHLLRNAVEATRPMGTIVVKTWVDKNFVVLVIQDTGRGMPPDVVEKVFVPFYTTKIGGTGLGMVFVRQIVDEHRGVITLESKLGQGTTVTIRLPYRFAERPEVSEEGELELPPPEEDAEKGRRGGPL